MMTKRADLTRFGLYGENPGELAPEFLHIEPISTRSILHDWTISPHSHPRIHQLLLLLQGSGLMVADGLETELRPHSLVAIPSHCVHAFRFDPGSEGWVFSFNAELLHDPRVAETVREGNFPARGAALANPGAGNRDLVRLRWLMADIQADLAHGAAAARLSNRIVAQFALLLATADELLQQRTENTDASRTRDLAAAFRTMVDRDFRTGRDIASYASDLATTVPTLTRACRAALGKAPGAVIRDRLLLEALRHLTFTSASVSQISGRLGFSDPAYFARFFKQRTGKSASQFREDGSWFANPVHAEEVIQGDPAS